MRRLLAVLGRDVSRSLSPLLHGAAARACDIDIAYVPVSCPDEAGFVKAVDALRLLGALGANVTIPYKFAALEKCDRVYPAAEQIGAVNTLLFRDDASIEGDNTDGPGLLRVFDQFPRTAFEKVQLLGAGGAARAAAWALREHGAREVIVCARRRATFAGLLDDAKVQLFEKVPGTTLIISALPPDPALAETAFREWVDDARSPMIYDLSYRADRGSTPLVTEARGRGLVAWDGRGMLLEQAALSLSLWSGVEVSRIRGAMRQAMGVEVFDSESGHD